MATQNYFKAKNGLEAPSQSTIAVTDSNFPTVRPTLNLDFAGSESVDSRITFTRASAATYTGADGKLKYAVQNEPRIEYDPVTGECKGLLIEEQRTNMLAYSPSMLTGWTYFSPMVNNSYSTIIAPNGSQTATALYSTNGGSVYQDTTASGTGTYTGSFYFNTASTCTAAVLTMFFLGNTTQSVSVGLNLSTGSAAAPGSSGGATLVGYTINYVGSGWYRVSLTGTGTISANTTVRFQLYNNVATACTLVVWGAQLEAGAFPTSYIPSTTSFTSRASSATYFDSTGTLRIAGANQARYGYGYDSTSGKWVSQGLVLEGAATNYVAYSGLHTAGTSGTAQNNSTHSLSTTLQPDASSYATAITATVGSAQHGLQKSSSGIPANSIITLSAFVKAGTHSIVRIEGAYVSNWTLTGGATFNLSTGVKLSGTGDIQNVGNGWYLISTQAVSNANVDTRGMWVWIADPSTYSSTYTAAGTETIYVAGTQMEVGSAVTSYIPTYGASTTRAADVSSSAATTRSADSGIMNIEKVTNQLEGTYFGETQWISVPGVGNQRLLFASSDDDLYAIEILRTSGGDGVTGSRRGIGTIASYPSSTSGFVKYAFGWNYSQEALAANGNITTSGAATASNRYFNNIRFGYMPDGTAYNGYVKRIVYYPKRLSNAQLQALTA